MSGEFLFIWREVAHYLDVKSLARLAQVSTFIRGVLRAHNSIYGLYLEAKAQEGALSRASVEWPTEASLLQWDADKKDCGRLKALISLSEKEHTQFIFRNEKHYTNIVEKCLDEEARGNHVITGDYIEWFLMDALAHAISCTSEISTLPGVNENALSFIGRTQNPILVSLAHYHLYDSNPEVDEREDLQEEIISILDIIVSDIFENCHIPMLDATTNLYPFTNYELVLARDGSNRLHKWVIEIANSVPGEDSEAREEKLIQGIIWAMQAKEIGSESSRGSFFEYIAVILSAKNKFGPIIRIFNKCASTEVSVNMNLILQDIGLEGPEAKEEDVWKWLGYRELLLWRQTFVINDYEAYKRALEAKKVSWETLTDESDETDGSDKTGSEVAC